MTKQEFIDKWMRVYPMQLPKEFESDLNSLSDAPEQSDKKKCNHILNEPESAKGNFICGICGEVMIPSGWSIQPNFKPTEADGWQKLADDIRQWSDATFGGQTSLGKAHHLEKEVNELSEELLKWNGIPTRDLIMEFADCMMLLLDCANHANINVSVLHNAVSAKLEINKARKWGALNADGFSEHIKPKE